MRKKCLHFELHKNHHIQLEVWAEGSEYSNASYEMTWLVSSQQRLGENRELVMIFEKQAWGKH